jgi:hypothetical protein
LNHQSGINFCKKVHKETKLDACITNIPAKVYGFPGMYVRSKPSYNDPGCKSYRHEDVSKYATNKVNVGCNLSPDSWTSFPANKNVAKGDEESNSTRD